jgi:hypothetical protein
VGGLELVVGGIELEKRIVLGYSFVPFVELLGGLGEEEMGVRVGGLVLDGVLAAKIGSVPVATVEVVAGDGDVLGGAIFVGLEVFDLGESATRRFLGGFSGWNIGVCIGVGVGLGRGSAVGAPAIAGAGLLTLSWGLGDFAGVGEKFGWTSCGSVG